MHYGLVLRVHSGVHSFAFFLPSVQIHGDVRNRGGRLLLLGALDAARPAHTRARGAPRRHGSDHRPRRGYSRKMHFLEVNSLSFQYFEWLKSCSSTHSTRRISLSVPEQPIRDFRIFTIRPYSSGETGRAGRGGASQHIDPVSHFVY